MARLEIEGCLIDFKFIFNSIALQITFFHLCWQPLHEGNTEQIADKYPQLGSSWLVHMVVPIHCRISACVLLLRLKCFCLFVYVCLVSEMVASTNFAFEQAEWRLTFARWLTFPKAFPDLKIIHAGMSAVLGSHLVNFWCQVFLLLLSQGVEVPSFQQFPKNFCESVYPTFANSWISGPYQLLPSGKKRTSIDWDLAVVDCHCLLRRFPQSSVVWAVRPTIIKSGAGVSRLTTHVLAMPPQSIHAASPERN